MVKEKDMTMFFFPSMEKTKKTTYRPVTRDAAATAKLSFPSMQPILTEREKAEQARVADILHPDLSKRLRFPSLGDPPRAKPVRTDFKSDAHFKAALNHYNQEQKSEAEVYRNSLR
jgi:hypothetical protein